MICIHSKLLVGKAVCTGGKRDHGVAERQLELEAHTCGSSLSEMEMGRPGVEGRSQQYCWVWGQPEQVIVRVSAVNGRSSQTVERTTERHRGGLKWINKDRETWVGLIRAFRNWEELRVNTVRHFSAQSLRCFSACWDCKKLWGLLGLPALQPQ